MPLYYRHFREEETLKIKLTSLFHFASYISFVLMCHHKLCIGRRLDAFGGESGWEPDILYKIHAMKCGMLCSTKKYQLFFLLIFWWSSTVLYLFGPLSSKLCVCKDLEFEQHPGHHVKLLFADTREIIFLNGQIIRNVKWSYICLSHVSGLSLY